MVSNIRRFFRHLWYGPWLLRRYFPAEVRARITDAIRKSEAGHSGEVYFVVERALERLPFQRCPSPRERALEVFALQRVWDTRSNNGILVYILLADHAVEIVADRGINTLVTASEWQRYCEILRRGFMSNEIEKSAIEVIEEISELLKKHFPRTSGDTNELNDQVTVL